MCPKDNGCPPCILAQRGHHRVTQEMLPVKVLGQFSTKLSNREGPTGVAGKAWTSHLPPSMVMPHSLLLVDRLN